jgi:hypothetical protein
MDTAADGLNGLNSTTKQWDEEGVHIIRIRTRCKRELLADMVPQPPRTLLYDANSAFQQGPINHPLTMPDFSNLHGRHEHHILKDE